MRRLGIDFGTKKVGVALTDPLGMMAFPHDVYPNDPSLLKKIIALIEEKEVAEVIIGHSLNYEGTPNKVHELVEAFMMDLTLETGLPIHLEPEQYSSKEAERLQGKHGKLDASAAAIILNSYIMKHR